MRSALAKSPEGKVLVCESKSYNTDLRRRTFRQEVNGLNSSVSPTAVTARSIASFWQEDRSNISDAGAAV